MSFLRWVGSVSGKSANNFVLYIIKYRPFPVRENFLQNLGAIHGNSGSKSLWSGQYYGITKGIMVQILAILKWIRKNSCETANLVRPRWSANLNGRFRSKVPTFGICKKCDQISDLSKSDFRVQGIPMFFMEFIFPSTLDFSLKPTPEHPLGPLKSVPGMCSRQWWCDHYFYFIIYQLSLV